MLRKILLGAVPLAVVAAAAFMLRTPASKAVAVEQVRLVADSDTVVAAAAKKAPAINPKVIPKVNPRVVVYPVYPRIPNYPYPRIAVFPRVPNITVPQLPRLPVYPTCPTMIPNLPMPGGLS